MGVYISIYINIMMISNGKNIVRHHCFQHFAYRSHSIFFECSIPQRMPSLVSLRSLCTFDTKLWLWTTYEVVITKIPQLIVISVDFQFNHSISYIYSFHISLTLFLLLSFSLPIWREKKRPYKQWIMWQVRAYRCYTIPRGGMWIYLTNTQNYSAISFPTYNAFINDIITNRRTFKSTY